MHSPRVPRRYHRKSKLGAEEQNLGFRVSGSGFRVYRAFKGLGFFGFGD